MTGTHIVVDGVRLGPESDFEELFRRQLRGDVLFESKSGYGPADGIVRVLGAARTSRLESKVRDAIMTLATDKDAAVRGSAVMAIGTYPRTFGTSALLALLDGNIQLFRKVPAVARGYADLEWELLQAIAATRPTSPEIIDRFKAVVVDPVEGERFVGLVAAADPSWTLGHAREVAAGQADRAIAVLWNLNDPAARTLFVQALRPEPAALRDEVIAQLSQPVRDKEERERLTKILTE